MEFRAGQNIAVKVPAALFERTVAFYRDTVGLSTVGGEEGARGFEFGGMTLWLDPVDHATHAEVWLELATDDVETARRCLSRLARVLLTKSSRWADAVRIGSSSVPRSAVVDDPCWGNGP